ncbi:MAG: hypothetical protein JSW15_11340 [Deltaproteobacteria bacterium]|nr:MAG: hypothetical protein JSW15_11340 [Deltaproteobacteria bacterium]
MKNFQGYHVEWNLGCPGGWEYQRMAQERGKLCWNRVKEISGIEIELSFDHPILNPVSRFLEMLLRVHQTKFHREKPYILLVAEEETLDKVTENINLVEYLNQIEGVKAAITSPEKVEKRGDHVTYKGQKVTVIFLDTNNDVLLRIGTKHNIEPLLNGIRNGIVVNPRGMEPVGAKGIFEIVTEQLRNILSPSTVRHTPWTRVFYPRETTGPDGELIPDLVEWVRDHWEEVIVKPVYGYSGKGIFVGPQRESRDEDIQTALGGEPYIVQSFIPKGLWAEEYPLVDPKGEEVGLKQWQTDFRCFINDKGLIGFLARFGGIPTNVGAGGGGQSVAILKTEIPVREAVCRINEAIIGLRYSTAMEIQEEVDKMGLELGHTYLRGPTPTTLRPRIITQDQLSSLQEYSANLWSDLIMLERMWQEGKLDHVVQMGEGEVEIAQMQAWGGSPALIASDCLFSFGAHLQEK